MLRARIILSIVICPALAACLEGCEDDSFSPREDEVLPKGAFIDDQILLEMSEPVDGVFESEEILFNLGEIPMVRDGTFNDIEISYSSGSNCDVNAWVYNYSCESWQQIGFRNAPDIGCFWDPRNQFHLLSAAGIGARDALGRHDQLKLRVSSPPGLQEPQQGTLGGSSGPTARALRINPDYFTVSLVGPEPRHCYGLTFDGEALWVSERRKLLRFSTLGDLLCQHCAPEDRPFGLAFTGRILLLDDICNNLSYVTLDGYGFSGWSLPTEYAGGLTYSPHRVWLGERNGSESKIFGVVDTVSIGPGGTAYHEVPDTLDAPGGSCRGLAYDGECLLVAGDSLYVITFDGAILSAYGFPVHDVEDIAWDGEAVWVVNRGPKDLTSRDQVITRFRLR